MQPCPGGGHVEHHWTGRQVLPQRQVAGDLLLGRPFGRVPSDWRQARSSGRRDWSRIASSSSSALTASTVRLSWASVSS